MVYNNDVLEIARRLKGYEGDVEYIIDKIEYDSENKLTLEVVRSYDETKIDKTTLPF